MYAEYTLTRDDYSAYIKHMQARIGKLARMRLWEKLLIWCFFVGCVISILHFITNENVLGLSLRWKYAVSSALFLFCIGGMTATYFFTLARRMTQAMVSDDSPLLGDYKVEVLEDGVVMSNAHAEAKFAWSMFRYIVDDPEYIYLLHDNGVGTVIPKRAFNSAREVQDFLTAIDAKLPYSQTS